MTGADQASNIRSDVLRQMFLAEYGDRTELVLRYSVITIASLALYSYAEQPFLLVWLLAFMLSQVANYLLLARIPSLPSLLHYSACVGFYFLTTIVYCVLPFYLFLFGDKVLAFCGGMGLMTLCVYTLWREVPPRISLPFDAIVGWLIALAAMYTFWPMDDALIGRAMIVLVTAAAASYYTLALISVRRNEARLKEAMTRSVESEKMEAIGRLSGGIAHDFNNILTVLRGNLELFDEVDDPDQKRELITEAQIAANRASGLVTQLLSFARRAPLAPRRVEADEIVAELAAMTQRVLPATIEFTVETPAVRLPLLVDPNRLLSAMLNLIINARDAMDGHGRLSLIAEVVDLRVGPMPPIPLPEGDTFVRLSVADTGPGMSREISANAVEPFFTTKGVGQGSGLGLPSAKGFAEQSGGALDINSEPGSTRVCIYLPLAPAA